MDSLESELKELKGFIADLKADRAAQKEKEKREAWTKYTSMSLVFIAVLAAIATQLSGKFSGRAGTELNKATLSQASASDAWGEYQANSIKRNLYEVMRIYAPKDASASADDAAKRDKDFTDKIAKYQQGQKDAQTKATDFEDQRKHSLEIVDFATKHAGRMSTAVSIFQISIAIGSICLVTKKKWLWYIAIVLASLATAQMLYVWYT
jgi:hypothetical protein